MTAYSRRFLASALLIGAGTTASAAAQEIDLAPTRPTIANGASIQSRGVLQVELGYDAFPQRVPGNQQTVSTLFTYTPLDWLRLDFNWSPYAHQGDATGAADGVGTIAIGGKVELVKEQYHRGAPGIAVQYEAELPTASSQPLQGYGQQATFLINHHYGRKGIVDVIANGSVVQDCEGPGGCSYGGQQSLALSYHLQEQSRLYAEVFGQNVSESNAPSGTYVFGGFYRQLRSNFGIDGGVRFGVTDHSSSIGTTFGIVLGKQAGRTPVQTSRKR